MDIYTTIVELADEAATKLGIRDAEECISQISFEAFQRFLAGGDQPLPISHAYLRRWVFWRVRDYRRQHEQSDHLE